MKNTTPFVFMASLSLLVFVIIVMMARDPQPPEVKLISPEETVTLPKVEDFNKAKRRCQAFHGYGPEADACIERSKKK